ncbi:MAG TPA: hypothetical protein PLY87_22040 [Planctomycetaceae bacterium]|nr:hypothetical protein [Planctomycetaceae bacterium]
MANRLRSRPQWLQAFEQLKAWLSKTKAKGKRVLFFDEFPWLASRRSGFLSAFEAFWNTFASRDPSLVCVICGSAASWMIQKVINSKGGLHNRATSQIRLKPFTLAETRRYLLSRKIGLPDFQIAQLYMAIGGVPHYLQRLEPGQSAAQQIDRLCFQKDGLLAGEFSNLYRALFENSDQHEAIVRALAKKRVGIKRTELAEAASLPSGGTLTKVLSELAESGFIREMPSHNATRKNSIWRLTDEYSLFYLTWIEPNRMTGKNVWLTKSSGQKWKIWCGYAFENLCLFHVLQIKQALGISGVLSEEAAWQFTSDSSGDKGAQIDLLIDRNDQSINICEMKFTESEFVIDKRYASELQNKLAVFRQRTHTGKALFLMMVTAQGVKSNSYSQALVTNEVKLAQLFAD